MILVKICIAEFIEQQHRFLKLLVHLVLDFFAIYLAWIRSRWLLRWFRWKDNANSYQLWVIFVHLFVKLLCSYPFFDKFNKLQYFGGLFESVNQFNHIKITLIIFKLLLGIRKFLFNGLLGLNTKIIHLTL